MPAPPVWWVLHRHFVGDAAFKNHDVPMRTNLEKVRILKLHNGANAVSTTFITPGTADMRMDWSLQHLQMFKNRKKCGTHFPF